MRHRNHSSRLNRTTAHKKALMRNLTKSLVQNGRVQTTVEKAKELKKVIEPLITLAKEDNVANRRSVVQKLAIRKNKLTPKECREAKSGVTRSYNVDRSVVSLLFTSIAPKYKERSGGYTRIVPAFNRKGDGAKVCFLELV